MLVKTPNVPGVRGCFLWSSFHSPWYTKLPHSSPYRGRGAGRPWPGRGAGRGRFTGASPDHHTSIADSVERHRRRARSESSDEASISCGASGNCGGPARSAAELRRTLDALDGIKYGALKQLTGQCFRLDDDDPERVDTTVTFLRVQSDPFAPGSQLCLATTIPMTRADLDRLLEKPPADLRLSQPVAQKAALIAAHDYVLRLLVHEISALKEHSIEIARFSQHVLQRDAVTLIFPESSVVSGCAACASDDRARVHFYLRAKLPGPDRRIDARGIGRLVLGPLLTAGTHVARLRPSTLLSHAASVLDQTWLRGQLASAGLVAFVPDGATLPRLDGIDDAPMPAAHAIPFTSPPSLAKTFSLPYMGNTVTGMGLPVGLTLIAGGGYHGKSTLLRALELGVYNHIPGDGRECVVVDPTAVKIRAEDRRSIHGVDVSPFINHLPSGADTTRFCTTSASGSTSQAAAIMEALELGSHALLLDEDTCATNFMFRDTLMAALVPDAQEPITPFVHRVRELFERHACSVVMVVGSSGQCFALADTVLVMQSYRVLDKTQEARRIAREVSGAAGVRREAAVAQTPSSVFHFPAQRGFHHAATFASLAGGGDRGTGAQAQTRVKISGSGLHRLRLGPEASIDLSLVEQLVEDGQTNALAQAVALLYDVTRADQAEAWLEQHRASVMSAPAWTSRPYSRFAQYVYACHATLTASGVHVQTPSSYAVRGFSAMPRVFELGAALNRMRGLCTGPLH